SADTQRAGALLAVRGQFALLDVSANPRLGSIEDEVRFLQRVPFRCASGGIRGRGSARGGCVPLASCHADLSPSVSRESGGRGESTLFVLPAYPPQRLSTITRVVP